MGTIFLKQGRTICEVKSIFLYIYGDKPVVRIQKDSETTIERSIESVSETEEFLENLTELLASTDKPFIVIEYDKDNDSGFTIKGYKEKEGKQ